MKENAKEYLKEFAISQSDCLKALIYEAIETNGNISEERKKEIYKNLSENKTINITEPNINNDYSDTEIYISSLKHISGVNALQENQIIKFNEDVTILYGMNGTGKSSYFKVLNEIVGGNQTKTILPNIYKDTQKPIDVKIFFYKKGETKQTITWNGDNRSLDLLNKCKVFDTSYLDGLLTTRKADSTLIQPLGLNLFPYLVDLLDEFKQKLIADADKKRAKKPILELQYLRDDFKNAFENHSINDSFKIEIQKLYNFTEDNAESLKKLNEELANLKQTNIQDKIKLKKNDKNGIISLKDFIENTNKKLKSFIDKVQKVIIEYNSAVTANASAKKQFEILLNIPANDTPEWKEFIKSGEKYNAVIEDSEICPYCRQPLQNENAVNLIKAYGKFLKDDSEQQLNKAIENINILTKSIESLSTAIEIEENIKLILENQKLEEGNLFDATSSIKANYTDIKKLLLKSLEYKKVDNTFDLKDTELIVSKLETIIESIQKDIDTFSKEQSEKAEQIKELKGKIKILLENESINKQKDKIEKWLKIDKEEKALKKKSSKIKTRKLSELSKSAHNELLTNALKDKFIEELTGLGYKNLDVQLESDKGKKGVSTTKLILTKNNNIKSILSEGEQKAVALALFIAETRVQKSKNPIILDDPVNSLDHKIASKFAERLLMLENQIILFNHNRMFLDAFETSKNNHICKTIDTDCSKSKGKHIRIYQVESEGKNEKGVLINYKANKASIHIKEAKRLLKKSPFDDRLKVAILLRKTVECTIDEIILNNISPTKYSNKNSRIHWEDLRNLNNDSAIIDILENIHSRVSGGEMHNGVESEENPIDKEEFENMISNIENIFSAN